MTPFDQRVSLDVVEPFRLDLTVAVLRRFSTNVVDRLDDAGRYVRLLDGAAGPVLVSVGQTAPGRLDLAVAGPPDELPRALAIVRRTLGVDRSLLPFYRRAAKVPWLRGIARRMRGTKPPRYPTLWEACVNAIVFQQISLFAASAILKRTIEALAVCREHRGDMLYAFPSPATLLATDDGVLRSAGLSVNKIAALRRIAEELLSGRLDEAMLEERATPDAAARLCAVKGIGKWTAAIVLLRGLGRLDLFPEKDSGAARSLASLGEGGPIDVPLALETLGPWRGMLYYHLLLARLEARGDLAPPPTQGRV